MRREVIIQMVTVQRGKDEKYAVQVIHNTLCCVIIIIIITFNPRNMIEDRGKYNIDEMQFNFHKKKRYNQYQIIISFFP